MSDHEAAAKGDGDAVPRGASPSAVRGRNPAWVGFLTGFQTAVLPHLPDGVARGLRAAADAPGNVLLHGAPGFPYAPLWSALAAGGDAAACLGARPATWGPGRLPYHAHPHFFHFDLRHPDVPADGAALLDFLREVVPTRAVHGRKHVVVLEHVDALCAAGHAQALRVLLERFAANVRFVATTHRLAALEPPLRSRFFLLRVPLPSAAQNAAILAGLGAALDGAPGRSTSLALWAADRGTPLAGDAHYPPLADFLKKPQPLEAVRRMANQLHHANVRLADAAADMLAALPPDAGRVARLAATEHLYQQRAPRTSDAVFYELALLDALGYTSL